MNQEKDSLHFEFMAIYGLQSITIGFHPAFLNKGSKNCDSRDKTWFKFVKVTQEAAPKSSQLRDNL